MTPDNQAAFDKFIVWEAASRDTIDFKKTYVDMVNDLEGGLMLSEIVYWYLPSRDYGENKLRVEHDGFLWIACRSYEWFDRARLTPDRAERALKLLINAGLVIKKLYKFNGAPTQHVRLNKAAFMARWSYVLNNPTVNPYAPKDSDLPKNRKSISRKTGNPFPEKQEKHLPKNPKTLTKSTALTSALITTGSDGGAVTLYTLDQLTVFVIELWLTGWAGIVSGKPYANKTYRVDAEQIAQLYPLKDVDRYTTAKAAEPKWKNNRPSWGIWVNDMGAWLANNPAQTEPAAKPHDSTSDVSESQRKALEAMKKRAGGNPP